MAEQTEHGRLIDAAAKSALLPLGCRRLGRSRTWISDHRFWVIQVEFQPSAWSKGSYLNVGAAWLWHARKGLAFNAGYRVADFISFENVDQFAPLIADMAAAAAREVSILRRRFSLFRALHRHLTDRPQEGWPLYHAAVAAGLSGDVQASRHFFERFDAWCDLPHWKSRPESESRLFAESLGDAASFRAAVSAAIERCRELNGLPSDPGCLDEIATICGQ